MRLQIRRVDHDCLVLGALGGQADHDPGEDPVVTPALPAVVEGLGRAMFLRRVTPAQTIAIDENYTAENTEIIDAGLAHPQENSPPDCFLTFGYSSERTASDAPSGRRSASKGCS